MILDFRVNANNLTVLDSKILITMRKNAELIDFSGNDCIDLVYKKSLKVVVILTHNLIRNKNNINRNYVIILLHFIFI